MSIILSEKQKLFTSYNGKYLFFGGARGGGKVQPLDSQVLTPFGFRNMGDIKVGDTILNPNGSPQKVVAVYPHYNHPFYRITFDDDSSTLCGLEHLWLVRKTSAHLTKADNPEYLNDEFGERGQIMTLEQIKNLLETKPKGQNICIPITLPLGFTKSYKYDMRKIPPYMLGVLLGDGCCVSSTPNIMRYTNLDDEIDDKIRSLGYDVKTYNNPKEKGVFF